MTQIFKNNAYASLASELSAAGTLAHLATGQGARFPSPTGGDFFLATLILLDGNGAESAWEIVQCTARATDSLTIERAQEGTTARVWPVGSRIEVRTTAGTMESFTNAAKATANIRLTTAPHLATVLQSLCDTNRLMLQHHYLI